ncbi:hypothetical protein GCK72_011600 [Caenorhabditis remanei]|uniref:Uncharacterized protein n=1 Tax=Caenorhabditis remanei TaxID=31234 RepID=A0A6A5H949_CAERE|nr:hypothetical protein GCK72_011600 [Caenorhabditis remanei]KAF1763334.1 hypothetical protein GCK72_011600 [Caenorhabditis remanei]
MRKPILSTTRSSRVPHEVDEFLVKCTNQKSMDYNMRREQKIDLIKDPSYTLHMLIYHTCSDDDTVWKQDEILDPVPVFDISIKRTQDFVMTKAIQVESLFGKH